MWRRPSGTLMPVVSWSASAQFSTPRPSGATRLGDQITQNLQVTAQITLYDGGANRLGVEAQKELVLATRASLRSVEQDVLLRIVEAYMEVRRNSEFVALRQNNLRLITQELRAAQDRFEVGEVTRTDVSLAEARLAAARSLLAAEQGGARPGATPNFAPRSAARPAPCRRLARSPSPPSPDEARAIAVRTHPAIEEAQHNVAAAEIEHRTRAEAAMRPTLNLQGSCRAPTSTAPRAASVGLSLSGPDLPGRPPGQPGPAVPGPARRDARRAATPPVMRSSSRWRTPGPCSRWPAPAPWRWTRRSRAADVAFRSVREEATLGARTTLDVLNAEQELLDARANLVSAQVDETIATYTLSGRRWAC